MSAKQSEFDKYLSGRPEDARATLEKLRQAIRAAAPDAVEVFAYGLPGFKYQGRPLIYIGAAKNHCAIYGPAVDAHREDLAGYDASKGTVRFPPNKPPPQSLLKKLVRARVAAIKEEAEARKRKKAAAKKSR